MTIHLRELESSDARAYFAVRLEALEAAPEAFAASASEWAEEPLDAVRLRLKENRASADISLVGAFDRAELVGITGVWRHVRWKLRHKGEVVAVYVRPAWRGRGVAGRLLDEILDRARAMPGVEQLQLGVGRDNEAATRLYRSRGFEPFGLERRALLVDGRYVDEVLMQRFLP